MQRKYLVLTLVLSLVVGACSLFTPRRDASIPNQGAVQVVQPTNAQAASPAPTIADPTAAPTAQATPGQSDANQPVEIKGKFQYTNDLIIRYYVEHAVALADMYGFVKRDREWVMPISSQYLGFMSIDKNTKTGEFDLDLPARPQGQLVDVNPDGKTETGVQVFTVAYFPNLTGGPFSEGDDISKGWPAYLTSNKIDTENQDEVVGGDLVIWAPDAQQSFPSSFGADGLLFNQDDPVMPVPAGYSVINLDSNPFKIIREPVPQLTLYEPADVALKDYSNLSYTQAFNQMFELVRKEYAFNGIQGKEPNWDQVHATVAPKVEAAEQTKDAEAFYLALREFTQAFKDGHVGVSAGDLEMKVFNEQYGGGYGFAIRQLDDGNVITVFILPDGPAARAGMKVGAQVTQYNGTAIKDAILAVVPPTAPHSTDFSLHYQQARYLLRAPIGTKATVTFTNPGAAAQTVDLTAVNERDSLAATSTFRGFDPNALPVEFSITPEGVGYIKINSNYDDLNLIFRLFQRALDTFQANTLNAIIIDMRQNSGGANLGLAGYLTDKEIPLGQLEYYSDQTGKFEPEGTREKVIPLQEQYRFNKEFLLVDQACASACELEAYGFSKVPGMVVIGQYPTSGTEAEVARGQFRLPEDMALQVPTGRFTLPDGSIFLEGQGVQPTVRVPINEQTVLSGEDEVLKQALDLASQP